MSDVSNTSGTRMDKTLSADGLDLAFLGVVDRVGQPTVFVYDYNKCVELLMISGNMSNEDAEEYMQFNVVGAWVGAGTPAFLKLCSIEDAIENIAEEMSAKVKQ